MHAEVLDACPLTMIGVCRGDPINVDLELATQKGIPVFHTPGPQRRRRRRPDARLHARAGAAPAGRVGHLPRRRGDAHRAGQRLPRDVHALHRRRAGRAHRRSRRARCGRPRGGGAPGGIQDPRPRLRPLRAGGAPRHRPRRSRHGAARGRHRLAARPGDAGDARTALRRAPGAHEADGVPRQHGARGAHRRERALRAAASRDASPARRSTCWPRSRCSPETGSSRCRTSSSRRTSAAPRST